MSCASNPLSLLTVHCKQGELWRTSKSRGHLFCWVSSKFQDRSLFNLTPTPFPNSLGLGSCLQIFKSSIDSRSDQSELALLLLLWQFSIHQENYTPPSWTLFVSTWSFFLQEIERGVENDTISLADKLGLVSSQRTSCLSNLSNTILPGTNL